MKNFIVTIALIVSFFDGKSQSTISFGFTPSLTLNFNVPTKASGLNEFKLQTIYPDFKGGITMLFERRKMGFNLGLNYLFSKYGWRVTYTENTNNGYVYNFDELILSTESLSPELTVQFLVTPFYHNNAKLFFGFGGGYSFITHTQLNDHSITEVHYSYFSKVLKHSQADVGTKTTSPFLKVGVLVQTSIKKIGKINYGIYYSNYLKPLPAMQVDLVINGTDFTSNFKTKHSYLEFFITYYILNFSQRGIGDKLHLMKYK